MAENKRQEDGVGADRSCAAQELVEAASMSPRQVLATRARARDRRHAERVGSTLAGPQRYDESGFPIAQRRASFAERVRHLLSG
jgi:hypothetical protein